MPDTCLVSDVAKRMERNIFFLIKDELNMPPFVYIIVCQVEIVLIY